MSEGSRQPIATVLVAALILAGCSMTLYSSEGTGVLNDPPRLYCHEAPEEPTSTADSLAAGCVRGEDERPTMTDLAVYVVGWSAIYYALARVLR